MSTDGQSGDLARRIAALREGVDYGTEQVIDDVTEAIVDRMVELGLTRAGLASLLGVSPARITNLLRGRNNFTVRTLAEVASVLECDLGITLMPRVSSGSAKQERDSSESARPEVAAETRAPYRARGVPAAYKSRDGEIREHLATGKLLVEDGVVMMRWERDGTYRPATFRKTSGHADKLRTNVGSRAYYLDRILAVAEE